jgi:hypothetical protein
MDIIVSLPTPIIKGIKKLDILLTKRSFMGKRYGPPEIGGINAIRLIRAQGHGEEFDK